MSGKGTAISRYRSQRTADPARTFFKDDKCGNVEAAGVSKNNCIHKPEPILHVRKRFVIIPSLTVKFIKTPLKALFYLGFSAVSFLLLYSLFSESDMDDRLL